MKKSFCLLLITAFSAVVLAQTPQRMSYQAVIRNSTNQLVTSHSVGIRISILQDSPEGASVYSETHTTTTNANGLATIEIGGGTPVSGNFDAINWSTGIYYIKTETDPDGGTSYSITGTSQLLSVPYALYSKQAKTADYNDLTNKPILFNGAFSSLTGKPTTLAGYGIMDGMSTAHVANGITSSLITNWNTAFSWGNHSLAGYAVYPSQTGNNGKYLKTNGTTASWSKLAVQGETGLPDEVLFEVKNKDGQTIFAVYDEGVRIFVNDQAKGAKGGFAVGGFGLAKQESQKYLYVDGDSIRAYVDTTSSKAAKGGFAVGGFGLSKGYTPKFLSMTPKNYFIGEGSGSKNTTVRFNSFVGFQSGLNNSTGRYNAFFGYQGGYNNTSGNSNLFLGYQSGFSNTTGSYNSFVGYKAGYANTTGALNTFIGSYSGTNNSSGYNNTFIGFYSGYLNTGGYENNFIGYRAGYSNSGGHNNIFMGTDAGYSNSSGNFNTFLGFQSGKSNTTASNNIFIGNQSGLKNLTGSSNVFLGNQAGENNESSVDNVFIGYLTSQNHTTGNNNIFIGSHAGGVGTSGDNNVFLGFWAGKGNVSGGGNIFLGYRSGEVNTTGYSNVFISTIAGYKNTTGYMNVLIGDQAGINNTTGYQNVIIGREAGLSNSTGHGNIMIGYQAGNAETGSDRLHIGQGSLIYGEIDNDMVRINGDFEVNNSSTFKVYKSTGRVGIGTAPTYKLDVAGDRIRLVNGTEWIAMRTDGGTGYLDLSFGAGSLVIQGSTTNENVIINPSMNKVGIRTWTPQYELDVNGSIRAIGSVYYGGSTTSANGTAYTKPDYVFGNEYSVMKINEVEDYLHLENHLPWVTSAEKEKRENGDATDMTRMAFETLETVENLQMQIIELNKKVTELSELIKTQETEIKVLKQIHE